MVWFEDAGGAGWGGVGGFVIIILASGYGGKGVGDGLLLFSSTVGFRLEWTGLDWERRCFPAPLDLVLAFCLFV